MENAPIPASSCTSSWFDGIILSPLNIYRLDFGERLSAREYAAGSLTIPLLVAKGGVVGAAELTELKHTILLHNYSNITVWSGSFW
jgi:hypothetical protein